MPLRNRILGKTNISVAEVGLGLWAVEGSDWGKADDKDSLEAIEKALEMGVNFFDTSDVYGNGHSEELLGRAMKGRRGEFVVSTKIGWRGFNDGHSAYTTADKLIAGVESNLKRLQTDYIDIIFDHINFQESTMPVFVEGFAKLQKQGKLKGYGLSTSDFEYLKNFNADGGCSVVQIDYSILNRTPEADILPYCAKENIGLVIRGPLAMGLLAGKFTRDSKFEKTDFRHNWIEDPAQNKTYREDLEKVEKLKPLAQGKTLAQLALQFTLANPATSVVIPGAKTPKQVEANVSAGLLPYLTAEELKKVDTITRPSGGRKIWPA
jgi:aryl-alcohol dehydrogenase-like predicted oxidoreductase